MSQLSPNMDAVRGPVWTAPADATDHSGKPIEPDTDFVVVPPPEIGPISSVESTLKLWKEPMSAVLRLSSTLALTALTAGGVYMLMRINREHELGIAFGAVLGVVTLLAAWWYMGFRHVVTFVGRDGMAVVKVSGSRAKAKTTVFEFARANHLRTAQTHQYMNGVYTGTTYDFSWWDHTSKRVFRENGQYRGKKLVPKPMDRVLFPMAGEIAWSQHYLQRIIPSLEQVGYADFVVRGKDVVRVGQGFLEFHFKGKVSRITPDEIRDLRLQQGTFSVAHKDAKWYSGAGKFSFQYGQMSNARVFLLLLEKLVGYKFG